MGGWVGGCYLPTVFFPLFLRMNCFPPSYVEIMMAHAKPVGGWVGGWVGG